MLSRSVDRPSTMRYDEWRGNKWRMNLSCKEKTDHDQLTRALVRQDFHKRGKRKENKAQANQSCNEAKTATISSDNKANQKLQHM